MRAKSVLVKKIELTLDTTREIQFNSNLFLAFIKFNSLSVDIPEMSVEKLENNIGTRVGLIIEKMIKE